jgi:hypothetical protein
MHDMMFASFQHSLPECLETCQHPCGWSVTLHNNLGSLATHIYQRGGRKTNVPLALSSCSRMVRTILIKVSANSPKYLLIAITSRALCLQLKALLGTILQCLVIHGKTHVFTQSAYPSQASITSSLDLGWQRGCTPSTTAVWQFWVPLCYTRPCNIPYMS